MNVFVIPLFSCMYSTVYVGIYTNVDKMLQYVCKVCTILSAIDIVRTNSSVFCSVSAASSRMWMNVRWKYCQIQTCIIALLLKIFNTLSTHGYPVRDGIFARISCIKLYLIQCMRLIMKPKAIHTHFAMMLAYQLWKIIWINP